jgi:hypothetical protein
MSENTQITAEMVERCIAMVYKTVECYPKYALKQMNDLLAKEIVIRALEAALADHVVGWRDIESAPKDGTTVDVCFDYNGQTARWIDVNWNGKRWLGGPTDQGRGSWVAAFWMPKPLPPTRPAARGE